MKLFERMGLSRDRAFRAVQNGGLAAGAKMAATILREELDGSADLAEWQIEALDALVRRICDPGETGLPSPDEVGAVDVALRYVQWMPDVTRVKLGNLIATLEGGPIVLGPARKRFSALTPPDQDRYLLKWSESALPPMRAAFHAIKQVAMMGYYSQPGAWSGIGYSIRGNPGAPANLRRSEPS